VIEMEPVTPAVPPVADWMTKLPLEVAVPKPVESDNAPPDEEVPIPDATSTNPPAPAVLPSPLPDVILSDPPRALEALVSPATSLTSPALPVLPDPTETI
jgi:hypothetical protein